MLVNKRGERIPEAPINIVRDRDHEEISPVIVNGISCMRCHSQGINSATKHKVADELRPYLEKNKSAFSPEELKAVQNLHPDKVVFEALASSDATSVKECLDHLSARMPRNPKLSLSSVSSLERNFAADLTLVRAAAEFGVSPEVLKGRLMTGKPQQLCRLLGPLLLPDGRVPRDVFIEAFPGYVKEWGHGDSDTSSNSPTPKDGYLAPKDPKDKD
jgi:serine/threonine-protein kinase